MLKCSVLGVALVALLGVACERKPAEETARTGPPAVTAEPTATAADREFLQKAAKGNESEVELARLAQDKAVNSGVKEFAEKLEKDHTDALDTVKSLARRMDVQLDTTPTAEKASLENKLSATSGKAFDREYVQAMIEDHQKGIEDFERARANHTGAILEFIEKNLVAKREHLRMAEELAKTM